MPAIRKSAAERLVHAMSPLVKMENSLMLSKLFLTGNGAPIVFFASKHNKSFVTSFKLPLEASKGRGDAFASKPS
jgi:hypothetical protein